MVAQLDLTVWIQKNVSNHCQNSFFQSHPAPPEQKRLLKEDVLDKRFVALLASQIKCMQEVYNQKIENIAAPDFVPCSEVTDCWVGFHFELDLSFSLDQC